MRDTRLKLFQRMAGASIVVMLALIGEADWANAQAGVPTIEVANTIRAEAGTQIPFPISVGPALAIPRNSFVRVRGLPPIAALSEGYSIAPGLWAVPLRALSDLKITLPATVEGRADVIVSLVAVDGASLAEVRTTFIVSSPPRNSAQSPAEVPTVASGIPVPQLLPAEQAERSPQPVPPRPATSSPPDHKQAVHLFKKGEEQLAQGHVAAARLLFERAVDLGLAQAAMALAATYDATEYPRLNIKGIAPDPKEARRWYERAQELGVEGAKARLRGFGPN